MTKDEENTFVLALKDNVDIMPELEKFVKEKDIVYGLIISGFGKMKEFILVSSTIKRGLDQTRYAGTFEVDAMSGKVLKNKTGKCTLDVKVLLSSTGFTTKAGQLINGKAAGMLEIGIKKMDLKRIIES